MADPASQYINRVNDAQARQFISMFTDATTTPVLASSDLDTLVAYSRRQDMNINPPDPFTAWQANTAYLVGAQVVAEPRNGSYFTCTVAGTSGATQPTWPTSQPNTVTDGTVTWGFGGGAPWLWTWQLAFGVKMGWEAKLGRIATVYDFSAGDQKLSRHQMFVNFKDMVDFWARRAPAQVKLMGSLRDRALYQNMTNFTLVIAYGSPWSRGQGAHWVN